MNQKAGIIKAGMNGFGRFGLHQHDLDVHVGANLIPIDEGGVIRARQPREARKEIRCALDFMERRGGLRRTKPAVGAFSVGRKRPIAEDAFITLPVPAPQ